ncbi:MAG: hypothetical protein IPP59_11325 [Betaproteobacteria bacterium]|nr:hypothetical protein [Candidatus Dechloromonas phosphorivorans]
MDLFEQVLHAIEGEETEGRIAYSADGQKSIQVRTFGPDRWAERAKMGRLDAINFLAVILFAVQDTFNLEQERRIVEEWAKIIRAAAMGGEMTPRDPVTLLPLKTLPDGWDWLVSLDDADTFVKAQGMGWSCTGIVEHLATQSTHPSIALMEQNPQLFTSKHVSAPSSAISSGTPETAEPPASVAKPADNISGLADLFDPVRPAQLEAMFPDGDKWKSYTERAKRNGLEPARIGRGLFNPYLAAAWWIRKGPAGWQWERCQRKLANNLPARSRDSKHEITGEYE